MRLFDNVKHYRKASTACFVIVSKKDIPIYSAEVGTAPRVLATSSFWVFSSWFDFGYNASVSSPKSDFLYLFGNPTFLKNL